MARNALATDESQVTSKKVWGRRRARGVFKKAWFVLLLLTPTLTEVLEAGRLPSGLRELATDVTLTAVVALLAWRVYRDYTITALLSDTDPLTGLLNRRRFDDDLDREVTRAHRLGLPLVLAYVDVDRFKSINDEFGHCEGDRVLQHIGQLLEASVRSKVDACYRIGGDEFAVLLPAAGPKGSRRIVNRLQWLATGGNAFLARYGSGLSVGVAQLEDSETAEDIVRRADDQLYRHKAVRRSPSKNDAGKR